MATTTRTVEVELSTTGLDAQGRPQRIPLATDEGREGARQRREGVLPVLHGERMEGHRRQAGIVGRAERGQGRLRSVPNE